MKVSDLRRKLMAALAAGGMLAPGYLHAANLNTNLVVNGDFETVDVNTLGGNYASPKILNWTGASAFAYAHLGAGGIGPDYANNAPLVSGGKYYFSADHHADPQNVDITAAGQFYQDIAVNAGATGTQIATGTAGYQISGFFSGYTTQPDKGTIQVDFLNGSGGTLTSVSLTNSDPTAWNTYTTSGTIPVGTATARVSIYGAPGFQGGPSAYIDNVDFRVTNQLPTLSVTVNRSTGVVTLNNQTGASQNISSYSIGSAFEGMVPGNWQSIADFYDNGNPGPNQVDPAHAWSKQSTSASSLAEGDPSTAGASLVAARSVNLGVAWTPTNVEDLVFQYVSGGTPVAGIVSYIGGPGNVQLTRGDLNLDGVINASDWAIVRDNQFFDLSALSLAKAYRQGDFTGDHKNDHDDFVVFKDLYDAANGPGAFAAMTSVPEPSTFVLLAGAGLAIASFHRRRTT